VKGEKDQVGKVEMKEWKRKVFGRENREKVKQGLKYYIQDTTGENDLITNEIQWGKYFLIFSSAMTCEIRNAIK